MNLRISKNQIRFRITQEEARLLTHDGLLPFSLELGTQTMEYAIALADLEQPLALDIQKNVWKLLVDRKALSQFLAFPPSREGIEQPMTMSNATITLVLEIDIRRKKSA